MAKYLISFPSAAMVVPDDEWEVVDRDAHAVIGEAKAAGVYVFGGGIDESVPPALVSANGTVAEGGYPWAPPLNGGFTVPELPSREAAVAWAALATMPLQPTGAFSGMVVDDMLAGTLKFMSAVTVSLMLFYSRGYSPQYLTWLAPLLVILYPNRQGAVYLALLVVLNMVELLLFISFFPDQRPWRLQYSTAWIVPPFCSFRFRTTSGWVVTGLSDTLPRKTGLKARPSSSNITMIHRIECSTVFGWGPTVTFRVNCSSGFTCAGVSIFGVWLSRLPSASPAAASNV